MMKCIRVLCTVCLMALQAHNALANSSGAPSQERVSVVKIEPLVKAVVHRNAAIVMDRLQVQIAEQQIRYERHIFEPTFTLGYRHTESSEPNNTSEILSRSNLLVYDDEVRSVQSSLSGPMYFGGDWSLSYITQGSRNSLVRSLRDYSREWESEVRLSLRQPLLRGAGTSISMAGVRLAKLEQKIVRETFRRNVMDLIAVTVSEYWRLHGAIQLQQSLEQTVTLLQKNLSTLKVRRMAGDVSGVEVLQLKRSLMDRQLELESISLAIDRARQQLLLLLNTANAMSIERQFITAESSTPSPLLGMTAAQCLDYAAEYMPDFRIATNNLAKSDVEFERADSEALPQLDLVLSTWRSYIDDRSIRKKAFTESDFHSWEAGLELSIPIFGGGRQSSALKMSELRRDQTRFQLETLKREVELEIQGRLEALIRIQSQYELSQSILAQQQVIFDETQLRFELGQVDIHEVLDAELELARHTRVAWSRMTEYKLAEVELESSVGMVAERYFPEFEQLLYTGLPDFFEFR